MKKIGFIHIMRIVAMYVTFLIDGALIIISILLFGVPSVLTVPLLISVFFIVDFLVIFFTKEDTFLMKNGTNKFKVWQTLYKIFFIIDAIVAPIFLIIGVITTAQNILERC